MCNIKKGVMCVCACGVTDLREPVTDLRERCVGRPFLAHISVSVSLSLSVSVSVSVSLSLSLDESLEGAQSPQPVPYRFIYHNS